MGGGNHVPTNVGIGIPYHWTLVGMLMVSIYMDLVKSPMAFVFLASCFDNMMLDWRKKGSRQLYYSGLLLFYLFNANYMMAPFFHLMMLYDRSLLESEFLDGSINGLIKWLSEIETPMTNPFTGNNGMASNFLETLGQRVRYGMEFGMRTSTERLRSLNVSNAPLELSQRIEGGVDNIVDRYFDLSYKWKMIIYGALLVMVLQSFGMFIAFVVIMFANLPGVMEKESRVQIYDENKTSPIQSGVYRIKVDLCGIPVSRGIGVSYEGVMHVPFHVTHGNPIYHNERLIKPYMVDVYDDIVTYGGPPRFCRVEEGDEVFVNTETDESRTSYKIGDLAMSEDSTVIGWKGVTKPGESGSPVIALRSTNSEDKKVLLVGQAGRYVKDRSGCVEFSSVSGVEADSSYRRIVTFPGSGKTTRQIPIEIRNILTKHGGGKVLLSGPTRVVCEEMYKALGKEFSVALNIKNSKKRNTTAKVQICAHATALKMLIGGAPELNNLRGIIIDEAHVMDPSTIMLREYAKFRNINDKLDLVEMSATLDGECDERSRYTVVEHEVDNESRMKEIIREKLESTEERVLIFVPGIQNASTRKLISEFSEYRPVILSRKEFESGMRGVQNLERRLIISTDIAECGINVPELDCVFDTNVKYGYGYDAGLVTPQLYKVNKASRVQRKGRVGRYKAGEYYSVKTKHPDLVKTAAEFDAEVLSSGREWSTSNNDWQIAFTDRQLSNWLMQEEDKCPMQIYLEVDKSGKQYSKSVIRKRVMAQRDGDVTVSSCCEDKNCPLRGKWKMFDMRAHDWLKSD
uniref:NS3-like protein n=1 Tax=Soybean thrips virus 1 TaxID=2796560 RepID=A0A7T3R0J0_9VIRU|nr:NS3-like protein [Soybean thrips virus 1]